MQFDQAALLLTYAWVGELCGHVVIPSLSDKIAGSRCVILAISVVLLSASFMILPHVAVYPAAGAAVVFVMGMQIGYAITMRTVLAADYLGVQKVTLCLGLIGIAMLPFTFVEPSIVGIGLGFITIATSMYIVSYFEMYRSFATGLQYLGISLSGVIGPSILSSVALKYGIEGTMLLVGGVTMNLVPLTLLLRHPTPIKWHDCRWWKRKDMNEDHMGVKPVAHVHKTLLHSTVERGVEDVHTRSGENEDEKEPKAETTLVEARDTLRESQIRYSQIPRVPEEGIKKWGVISQVVVVLRTPTFYMILLPIVAADMTLPLFSCTIVDYAGDKGVPLDVAAVLVSCQCAGGFCGRLVIPLISDRTPSGRCAVGSVTFLLIALCFVVMPHVISLAAIAAVTFIAGAQQGYLATIKTVFVADYLGVNKVAVCWGITGFLSMPVLFCQPYIIGAFRDRQGSYDNLYRLCGAVDVVAALMLVVQVFLDLRNRRRKGPS
ncbi:hypothetical protein HPB50_002849 [Hyalomma asiaticum]|uniref:Uncharacterized protein n=1 Tax=Hyalomma asiaticum TaxID=266040 RepID=A0ACB7SHE6_HYAAI|nr:hypothetical protein HPB50_002849 [Hyalomma asiaticum]